MSKEFYKDFSRVVDDLKLANTLVDLQQEKLNHIKNHVEYLLNCEFIDHADITLIETLKKIRGLCHCV